MKLTPDGGRGKVRKVPRIIVSKLRGWSQFNQYFMREFFVRKQIEQLFSKYVWLCDFWHQNIIQKMRR